MQVFKTIRLLEVAKINMGQSPPGETYNIEGIGLPFFQGKAEFGDLYPVTKKWCSKPRRTAEPGDILLSVRAPVGPINIAKEKCCIGRGLASIRGNEKIVIQHYLQYYFKKIEYSLFIQGQGSTFYAISRKDVEKLIIPIPPISEQKRIVEILDQADDLRKKRAEADAIAERIIPALFYKMFGDPVTNEMGWNKMTLNEAKGKVRYGLGQPPKLVKNGIPMIRATNISKGNIFEKNMIYVDPNDVPKSKNAFLNADEVLVVRSGAYTGDVAQVSDKWENSVAGYDLVITPGRHLTGEYIESYLLSKYIQNYYFKNIKMRGGQPHLNAQQLLNTPFLIPPKPLQENYAKIKKELRNDTIKRDLIRLTLESLFSVILHRAFTGELTAKWREANMQELLQEMEIQAKYLNEKHIKDIQ